MFCPWIGRSPVSKVVAYYKLPDRPRTGTAEMYPVVVLLASVLVLVTAAPPAPHTLEEAAHHFDMILNNTRSRENYIRCFLDKGICNKESLSIKRILTDALATNCSSCTPTQRLGADRFFQYLQERQPDTWTTLSGKYHPAGASEDDDDESDDSDDDDDDEGEREKDATPVLVGSGLGSDGGNVSHNSTTNSSNIDIIF